MYDPTSNQTNILSRKAAQEAQESSTASHANTVLKSKPGVWLFSLVACLNLHEIQFSPQGCPSPSTRCPGHLTKHTLVCNSLYLMSSAPYVAIQLLLPVFTMLIPSPCNINLLGAETRKQMGSSIGIQDRTSAVGRMWLPLASPVGLLMSFSLRFFSTAQ